MYRDDKLILPDSDTAVRAGDEVMVITERDQIAALEKRYGQGKPDAQPKKDKGK
jgi:Trk K+ transport system NAD-binding subunit